MENELIKLTVEEAESVYCTGGLITVRYIYENSVRGDIEKETHFRFTECGLSFGTIKAIYRTKNLRDVEFYVDSETYKASEMCKLMCN